MVQLSSSPSLDVSPPNECSEEAKGIQGSPKMDSPQALSPLQLALAASTTTYQGYETYIEDGLICLKHKIRNIEKKKQKLDDYMKRLKSGEKLNQDQLEAVGKYEEVLHNLMFAKELQKTIGALTQDLLKAQRKAVRREQVLKMEVEKRRLRTVLHVHFILQTLQQEHVRKDFRSGLNGAPFLSAIELQHLLDLAALLGYKRNESMSLQDQMEQASIIYWDLLEGSNKPVAGSTYKHMKEQLSRLMDCGYFDHIPIPQTESLCKTETLVTKKIAESRKLPGSMSDLSTLMSEVPTREFLNRRYKPDSDLGGRGQPDKTQAPGHSWKAEFLALKQQEPPDSWDTEFPDRPVSPQPPPTSKTSRGATGFVPKLQKTAKTPTAEPKQKRGQKLKGEPDKKMVVKAEAPVEVFDSPSSLPEDPVLRKRQLEDLMDQIQGSFSFMQDSVFDSEGSPINGRPQMSPPAAGSTAPVDATAAQRELKSSPAHLQSKPLHSTPIPVRLLPMDGKISLTNGEQPQDNSELDLAEDEVAHELPQRSESEGYSSPPLYRRESAVSVGLTESVSDQTPVLQPVEQSPCDGALSSASCQAQPFTSPPSSHSLNLSSTPFQGMHTVFKTNAPLPPRSDSDVKSDSSTFSDSYNLSYTTASTQTPPDVELQEQDQLPPVTTYQLESPVTNGCQVYLSPGQPAGNLSRPGQPYYARGSVRGGYEGYRNNLRSPGGGYVHQSHATRECAPVLYGIREYGYQLGYKRGAGTGGQRNNSRASWSNSSQVSSPERDNETFVSMDSGHGDSRCITPINVPMAAQDPALMPVHVYPLTQQMRVAFSAARTANFAPGSLDQTIIFDQLQSNLGETFDLHLGRFSCPVNGTYVFIFHILKLAVNVPLYVNLMKNEEVMVSAYANDGAPDHETASNHAVLQLYQGDQIWLRLHRGAIYGSSWKYSTFSGYLLYQD